MSTLPISSLAGGSEVCSAAREVAAGDEALRAFNGCSTPLAQALLAVVRDEGVKDTDDAPVSQTTNVNLTAEWLKTHYHEVFPLLVSHLSAKMARSRELGVVEDHVQHLLARFVERDVLAPKLSRGEDIKMSVLRMWAYQSACTELRRWGVDASLRASRCAKTSREVQQGRTWRVIQAADTAREIVREDEASSDLYDPAAATPEDVLDRQSRVQQVCQMLARTGHQDLIPVVNGLLEGRTLTELRDTYGTTTDQLTSVLEHLRG